MLLLFYPRVSGMVLWFTPRSLCFAELSYEDARSLEKHLLIFFSSFLSFPAVGVTAARSPVLGFAIYYWYFPFVAHPVSQFRVNNRNFSPCVFHPFALLGFFHRVSFMSLIFSDLIFPPMAFVLHGPPYFCRSVSSPLFCSCHLPLPPHDYGRGSSSLFLQEALFPPLFLIPRVPCPRLATKLPSQRPFEDVREIHFLPPLSPTDRTCHD